MQLNEQTDMFPELARGRRFWLTRGVDPGRGQWVLVTEGEQTPGSQAVEQELGFEPAQMTEITPHQALRYTPSSVTAALGEATRCKKKHS
jgi:hypothetical protein